MKVTNPVTKVNLSCNSTVIEHYIPTGLSLRGSALEENFLDLYLMQIYKLIMQAKACL